MSVCVCVRARARARARVQSSYIVTRSIVPVHIPLSVSDRRSFGACLHGRLRPAGSRWGGDGPGTAYQDDPGTHVELHKYDFSISPCSLEP